VANCVLLNCRSRPRDSKGPGGRRHRKPYKYWDVAPVGFEHMSPLQYKAMQGKLGSLVIGTKLKLL